MDLYYKSKYFKYKKKYISLKNQIGGMPASLVSLIPNTTGDIAAAAAASSTWNPYSKRILEKKKERLKELERLKLQREINNLILSGEDLDLESVNVLLPMGHGCIKDEELIIPENYLIITQNVCGLTQYVTDLPENKILKIKNLLRNPIKNKKLINQILGKKIRLHYSKIKINDIEYIGNEYQNKIYNQYFTANLLFSKSFINCAGIVNLLKASENQCDIVSKETISFKELKELYRYSEYITADSIDVFFKKLQKRMPESNITETTQFPLRLVEKWFKILSYTLKDIFNKTVQLNSEIRDNGFPIILFINTCRGSCSDETDHLKPARKLSRLILSSEEEEDDDAYDILLLDRIVNTFIDYTDYMKFFKKSIKEIKPIVKLNSLNRGSTKLIIPLLKFIVKNNFVRKLGGDASKFKALLKKYIDIHHLPKTLINDKTKENENFDYYNEQTFRKMFNFNNTSSHSDSRKNILIDLFTQEAGAKREEVERLIESFNKNIDKIYPPFEFSKLFLITIILYLYKNINFFMKYDDIFKYPVDNIGNEYIYDFVLLFLSIVNSINYLIKLDLDLDLKKVEDKKTFIFFQNESLFNQIKDTKYAGVLLKKMDASDIDNISLNDILKFYKNKIAPRWGLECDDKTKELELIDSDRISFISDLKKKHPHRFEYYNDIFSHIECNLYSDISPSSGKLTFL